MLPTLALGIDGWTLRAWRDSDAPALAEHASNPKVWRNMSDSFPHPYVLSIAEHWVRRGHIEFGGDNWAIAFQDQAVGGCGIHREEGGFRCNAEIGYWIAEPYWGRGVGTQVARTLTEHAFDNPEVTRVFAPIHAYNPASIRVVEKAGFVREGVLRLSAIKAGQVIDRVLMARYRPDIEGAVPALPGAMP
jgi:RimJ/RimL family protein N-acetyltransferase